MQLKILQTNTSLFSELIFITQHQIIIVCHLFYMLLKYTTCQKLVYRLGDCIQYATAKTLKLYQKTTLLWLLSTYHWHVNTASTWVIIGFHRDSASHTNGTTLFSTTTLLGLEWFLHFLCPMGSRNVYCTVYLLSDLMTFMTASHCMKWNCDCGNVICSQSISCLYLLQKVVQRLSFPILVGKLCYQSTGRKSFTDFLSKFYLQNKAYLILRSNSVK